MSFTWPAFLVALALAPLLTALYVAQRHRAKVLANRYNDFGQVVQKHAAARGGRGWAAPVLLLTGLTLLTVGMARPQATVQVPRLEGTIVLAFDVSGSMAAADVEPSRMEAAKAAAREFIMAQPTGIRIGVVAFSDSGFSVQPPGYDREEILAAVDRLSPQRGTSLGNGILVSLDMIEALRQPEGNLYSALTPMPTSQPTELPPGEYSSASIVLVSDGENTERPDPLEAAEVAAKRGVRVYAIGVGTAEGANLTVEGITIRTRLDESALKGLAELTGGQYFAATSGEKLQGIFDELEPELVLREEPTELTAFFAAAGSILLLAGAMTSMLRSGRVA